MLVLSRKPGESIFIGEDVEITITKIDYGRVQIAISAPREVLVVRGEIIDHVEELRETFGVPKKSCLKSPWDECLQDNQVRSSSNVPTAVRPEPSGR